MSETTHAKCSKTDRVGKWVDPLGFKDNLAHELLLAETHFFALREEFLDLYAALEMVRVTAEAAGRKAPDGILTKAHDAFRAKLALFK